MLKLIAFLGNIGKDYVETRHNVGWLLAEHLSFSGFLDWKNKFKGVYAKYSINKNQFVFLKPHTLMNKSGESIGAAANFFKFTVHDILVVHDEIELEYGQISFRKGGGLAGHNGLRSIAQLLASDDFYRFRLGISRPKHGNVSSYVLSKFTSDEKTILPVYLSKAAIAFEFCIQNDIQLALSQFKKENII